MTAQPLTSPNDAMPEAPAAAPVHFAINRGIGFARPSLLIDALRQGVPIILCDDEDRENEGDLVFAAVHSSPRLVAQMIRECGGLICVALAPELATAFGLKPMVPTNQCPKGTAFTASVDAARGVSTGISARDRALTIRLLGDPRTRPEDLVSPGHVFPLAARPGLLDARQGHTEASVSLAISAGLPPAAAICEILDEEGEAMRRDALFGFARRRDLLIGTVAALSAWSGLPHC
jgi:3,4-dihydroxy 2-butanone 4-phosphate synthase/GTP cyclohydrolase II